MAMKQNRRKMCLVGMQKNGKIYADHRDLRDFLFQESKRISPNSGDVRSQVHVLLIFEEMYNEEKTPEGKMAWLIAIAFELGRLEKMEPISEEERAFKADMLLMYAQDKTWKNAQKTIKGLNEQIAKLRVKLKEAGT